MFDEFLLDSSPSRAPVLQGIHWLISLAAGVLAFLTVFFGLPVLFVPPEMKVLIAQSVILGSVFFFYAAFLCYVYADSRHLGLSTWLWFVVTLLLNLVGYLIYLIYSAVKTDNWKRATLPIAYILETILVGVTVLVPLIYTEALPKAQLMTFLAAPPPTNPPPSPSSASSCYCAGPGVSPRDRGRHHEGSHRHP